ncbi:MAG: hypothetical protein QXG79_05130 [Saccharolobus sp.]
MKPIADIKKLISPCGSKVVIGNNQVKIDDDNKTPSIIRGQNKYSIVRLYYYLTKGIYLLPRLCYNKMRLHYILQKYHGAVSILEKKALMEDL